MSETLLAFYFFLPILMFWLIVLAFHVVRKRVDTDRVYRIAEQEVFHSQPKPHIYTNIITIEEDDELEEAKLKWKCPYCGKLNNVEIDQCTYCNAPRRS